MSQDHTTDPEHYRLEQSNLTLTCEALSKLDDRRNTVSAILLADLHDAKLERTPGWIALTVAAVSLVAAAALSWRTTHFAFRYVVAPALGLIGLLALIGGAVDRVLVCRTRHGVVRFPLLDPRQHVDAFLVTLKRLQADALKRARTFGQGG